MSSLFRKVLTGAKETLERLKEKAVEIIDSLESWIRRIRRHRAYIREVEESASQYEAELVDLALAENLKELVNELAPEGLVTHVQKLSFEDRREYIEKVLLPQVASRMGISYDRLVWIEDNDGTCGYYQRATNTIAINSLYLSHDDPRLLTIVLNTIFHECKHARQWLAVNGVDFGYSKAFIERMKRNFDDYIDPKESDEGYFKQPAEEDARWLANAIVNEEVLFGE